MSIVYGYFMLVSVFIPDWKLFLEDTMRSFLAISMQALLLLLLLLQGRILFKKLRGKQEEYPNQHNYERLVEKLLKPEQREETMFINQSFRAESDSSVESEMEYFSELEEVGLINNSYSTSNSYSSFHLPARKNALEKCQKFFRRILCEPFRYLRQRAIDFKSKKNAHSEYERFSDFVFPQRLLAAVSISIWLMLLFYVESIYLTYVFENLFEVVLLELYPKLLQSQINLISNIFISASLTAASLSFVLVSAQLVLLMRSYRRTIFKFRRGNYLGHNRRDFPVQNSLNYIGYQATHSLFSFGGFYLLLWMIGVAFATIILVDRIRLVTLIVISVMLVGTLLNYIIFSIISTCCLSKHKGTHVNMFRCFAFTDLISIFTSIFVGIGLSLARFIVAVLLLLLNFVRLDHPLLPPHYSKFDSGYSSYLSMLWLDHQYNNPIVRVFLNFCEREVKDTRIGSENELLLEDKLSHVKSKRARKRWHLAFLLLTNPSLINLRKHHMKFSRRK